MPIEKTDQLSLLRISGRDATDFLQGQLTNDITRLDSGWQYSGYCNPKGRLLTVLRIWSAADGYYALLNRQLEQAIVRRLRMYVLRSQVQIETIENAVIAGLDSIEILADIVPQLAGQTAGTESKPGHFSLLQYQQDYVLVGGGSMLFVSPGGQAALPEPAADSLYCWHDQVLLAGVPEIGTTTSELFVPQMVNLDLLGGISFKKGCYTGQEIVARMHYLGKLKQRMFLCDLSGAARHRAQPGDKIYGAPPTGQAAGTDQTDDGQASGAKAGTLVSISSCNRYALAVLRLADLKKSLRLGNDQRMQVRTQQPYPIDSPEDD